MNELARTSFEPAEAEIIEDDLMISGAAFEIDMSGIQRDIEELTSAIDNALTIYGDLAVEPEAIAAMDMAEARQCERAVSAAIREADELRRQLNRDYRVPLDIAKQRYDELMGPVIALHAAYKQRRLELDEAEKNGKKLAIRTLYEDMATHIALPADDQSAPLVPFERVFERFGAKWLNKGCSIDAIELELVDIVGRLLAGERRLDEAELAHDTEARAVYWETFDADAALARDRELCSLEQAQAAREAQRAELAQLKPEPAASPAAETPVGKAPARKPRVMLIDGATDDECRQIAQFCKTLSITGAFKGERFYEAVKNLLS